MMTDRDRSVAVSMALPNSPLRRRLGNSLSVRATTSHVARFLPPPRLSEVTDRIMIYCPCPDDDDVECTSTLQHALGPHLIASLSSRFTVIGVCFWNRKC